jgi:hypothetical protein
MTWAPSGAVAASDTTTRTAVAATYTNSGAAQKNYAASAYIHVTKSKYRGYVQFDTTGTSLDRLIKAELLLTPKSATGSKKVVVRSVATTSLAGLTKRTAPGTGVKLAVSGKMKAKKRIAIKINDLSAIKPTTVLTLNLTGSGKAVFYKKGAKAPVLRLTTSAGVSSVTQPTPTPTPTPSASPTTPAPAPSSAAPTTPAPTSSASPTAAPQPSQTSAPAPSVSVANPPASTSTVGSLPVGSASYAVPAGAIYVAPLGTSDGDGSLARPYGSLRTALSKASSGATIVLRAGTYHESVEVPFYKKLVIQAYPKEAVWFDGASTVTGWKASGNTWYAADWNYNFDHTVSFTKGQDQTSWWVNSSYPMAGHPDQVWVNGKALDQVGSASAVTTGKFFVDTSKKRLVIGTDPSGKNVEASTLQKAITVHGEGSTLRGFGVKRYATTVNQMGAVSLEVANLTAENLVITQNATIGLYAWGKNPTVNKLTITENGLLGFGLDRADGAQVTNSDISFNNNLRFNEEPVAGGIKAGHVANGSITKNLFEGNYGSTGLWFDSSSYNVTIAGNTFANNGADGLEVEISDTVRVVNNYSVNNAWSGIRLFDTSHAEVWNNTVANNARFSFRILQDERRSGDAQIPFISNAINLRNNVVVFANSYCPMLVQDITNKMTAAQMNLSFKANAYHRTSASAPSDFICWANGSGLSSYKSLDSFRSATGQDAQSVAFEGTSILTGAYKLTSAASASAAPVAVNATVAGLMGVNSGWTGMGAAGPMTSR